MVAFDGKGLRLEPDIVNNEDVVRAETEEDEGGEKVVDCQVGGLHEDDVHDVWEEEAVDGGEDAEETDEEGADSSVNEKEDEDDGTEKKRQVLQRSIDDVHVQNRFRVEIKLHFASHQP